jgi:hypothetical protein
VYVPGAPYRVSIRAGAVGVTLFDAVLTCPVPAPLVARTLNVYAVQLVSPDTATGEDAPVPVMQPGLEIAVYEVMALLPVQDGAVKATLTAPPVAESVAVPIVGAPGLRGHKPCRV